MSTLVLVLFIVAWAAVAFAIVRALSIAWGFHRRFAAATAVAVAGAFALGAISPFALPGHVPSAPTAPSVAAAAPAGPPPADTAVAVTCPAGAIVSAKMTAGHLDSIALGSAAATAPPPTLAVPPNTALVLNGWIVLDTGPPTKVCAIVDGRTAPATIRYGTTRPDVAAALGKPGDAASGFTVTLKVARGAHVVNVGAVEPDGTTVHGIQNNALSVQAQ